MIYLSVPGLKALAWTFIAIDILLTIGRFSIKWHSMGRAGHARSIKRFGIDDALHLLALLGAITYVALQCSGLAIFLRVQFYNIQHKGHVDLEDENRFFHVRLGAVLIFWITLYCIKFSFLMFYRNLFWVSHTFRKYWYAVATFTFTTFLASFLACFWVCGWPINPLSLTQCLKKHSTIQNHIEYVWVALNAASTILILLLPLGMIRGLKIRPAQKVSLAAMFILASGDMAFDFARTFYTTKSVGLQSLWAMLEITIAVMLSALISYRTLLTMRRKKASSAYASSKGLMQHGTPKRSGASSENSAKNNISLNSGERELWRTEPKYSGEDSTTQVSSISSFHTNNVV